MQTFLVETICDEIVENLPDYRLSWCRRVESSPPSYVVRRWLGIDELEHCRILKRSTYDFACVVAVPSIPTLKIFLVDYDNEKDFEYTDPDFLDKIYAYLDWHLSSK